MCWWTLSRWVPEHCVSQFRLGVALLVCWLQSGQLQLAVVGGSSDRLVDAEQVCLLLLLLLLQDMCIVLELRDATLLVASLKKVAAVASAIPSVEAFVAQVGLLADNQPQNCTPVTRSTYITDALPSLLTPPPPGCHHSAGDTVNCMQHGQEA